MSILSSSNQSTLENPRKVVRFQLSYNLESLLLDFVNQKDKKNYEDLLCMIRDVGQELRDDDLVQLLKEARGCISILDGHFRLFVQVVLILRWTHRSEEAVKEYQGFLLDLCAAHNYYTKIVIDHLVGQFKSVDNPLSQNEWTDKHSKMFEHVHFVIKSILAVIPMSRELLINSITSNHPYMKRPAHEHECYLYNVLEIIKYLPLMRHELLKIIITKLMVLEVNSPRSVLEETVNMEVDGVFEMDDVKHPVAHSLDLSLNVLFKYIDSEVKENGEVNFDKLKLLYSDFMKIFEVVILPTHATHHIQFLLFYLLGLKSVLAVSFLKNLWKKLSNPSIAPILRQTAVCYIASLLARAKYVTVETVQEMLSEMANWIHSYIASQDESGAAPCQDPRLHGVFYSTCQALFYVIAFRYKELVNNKGLILLQSLNLSKIVTCRLNPLKICLPVVVSNFASIARAYQLAYCYTIIERNSRNSLPQLIRSGTGATTFVSNVQSEAFFPFDPYLLSKSKSFVSPFYREYSGPNENEELNSSLSRVPNDDEDDFLEAALPGSSALANFSYSSSPGFLHVSDMS